MRTSIKVVGLLASSLGAGAAACSSSSTNVTASDAGYDGSAGDAASRGDGGSTFVDAASFKQTCTVSSDCAVVLDGDQCAVCRCPNALVSKSDEAAFRSAASKAATNCAPQASTTGCGVDCAMPAVGCNNGVCKFGSFGASDASTDAPGAG